MLGLEFVVALRFQGGRGVGSLAKGVGGIVVGNS